MIACPGCGAGLRFDISAQQMKCDHCGGLYDPARFAGMEKDAERHDFFEAYVFNCPGCGAELFTADETDAVGTCPYCGGSAVIFDRLKQVKMPTRIIPFRVTKEACKKAYAETARRLRFVPARCTRPEQIDSFRGIYMPYWCYTVEQSGPVRFRVASAPRSVDGSRVTEHFEVDAQLDTHYEGYEHDASSAFEEEFSECIGPFDPADSRPFSPGYLSGFYADSPDVPAETYEAAAVEGCEQETADRLLGSESVKQIAGDSNTSFEGWVSPGEPSVKTGAELVYYPVWFMSYRDRDRVTYAAVNGQTGKVVADFPVSPARFLLAALLIAAALFLALNLLFTLKPERALLLSTLLMLAGVWISLRPLSAVQEVRKPTEGQKLIEKFVLIPAVLFLIMAIVFLSTPASSAFGLVPLVFSLLLFLIRFPYLGKMFGLGKKTEWRFDAFRLGRGTRGLILAAVLAAGGILFAKPVYNLFYYIPVFVEAVLLFAVIYRRFLFQRSLAMRQPPQFNKRGGDDRA